MADPDPESEALIRQLHRELNGLNRRSRHQPIEPVGLRRLVSDAHKSKDKAGSVTHSEHSSDRAVASRPASEGEPGSVDHRSVKPKRTGDKQDAGERANKLARRTSPVPQQPQPQQQQQQSQQPQQPQQQHSRQQQPGQSPAAKHKAPPASQPPATGKVAANTAVPPAAVSPPAVPLTPLEEAAAMASSMTRAKLKQTGASHPTGGRVKCFHAGVRWGITLSTEALLQRSDLAAALNEAYAEQILSCGRGEMLHVLFIDADGKAVEFPALRSDVRENADKWRACAEKAVRVYVRRPLYGSS